MDLRVIVRSVLAAAALMCTDGAVAANLARCIGAYGEPMFTQQCPGLPVVAAARPRDAGQRPAPHIALRRLARSPATAFCARSPQVLAAQVQAAIHARNGVRLSGYALWRGRSSDGVRGDVRGLLQVIRWGFADVQLLQRPPGAPGMPQDEVFMTDRRPAAGSGYDYALVITSLEQRRDALRRNERRFGITRDHGCYWLTLAPAAWLADAPHSAATGADGGDTELAWDSR